MKRIPIAAGQRIAEQYGYDQVVIIARKVGPQNVGGYDDECPQCGGSGETP